MNIDTKILHIVNGDGAITGLKRAGIKGDFLNWLDPLYDGPVPCGASAGELCEIRARFVADCGWETFEQAAKRFRLRDEKLAECGRYKEVIIWNSFELFDQLHLLQLLDRFSNKFHGIKLNLIFVETYLGNPIDTAFLDLEKRRPVTSEQLALAREGWRAFTADEPSGLVKYLDQDLSALPFMKNGLRRLLSEFPDASGVSLTQRRMLETVKGGSKRVVKLFGEVQRREKIRFMGDWSFWLQMAELLESPSPLLQLRNNAVFITPPRSPFPDPVFQKFEVDLTRLGRRVLKMDADWWSSHRSRRWVGGVNLQEYGGRWDGQRFVLPDV